jgi:hypothetical protein
MEMRGLSGLLDYIALARSFPDVDRAYAQRNRQRPRSPRQIRYSILLLHELLKNFQAISRLNGIGMIRAK